MDLVELTSKMNAGDAWAAWQLVDAARAQGDLALAIDAAARLGARQQLVALADEVWGRPDLLKLALTELGLAMAPEDIERIDLTLAKINGNQRKNLLLSKHILQCLDEARHADEGIARRPMHGRYYWMARRTQRGFCRSTRDDESASILLEIGFEEVESYSTPRVLGVEARVTLQHTDIPQHDPLSNTIPLELAESLESGSRGFAHLMNDLLKCRDEPWYPEAVALAEQSLERWHTDRRMLHHYPTLSHMAHPHGRLIRATSALYEDFVKALDKTETVPLLRSVELTDLRVLGDTREDPLRFQRLHSLERLSIKRPDESPEVLDRLSALRFPASLRTFCIDRLVKPEFMAPLLEHLMADCPDLETFVFLPGGNLDDSERNAVLGLIAGLPDHVSMELLKYSSVWGDTKKFKTLYKQLDEHLAGRIHAMEVSDCKEGHPLLTVLGRSRLVRGLRRLTVDSTEGGGLAALFSTEGWRLDSLKVELQYARNLRFYRKKPHDAAFMIKDFDRLCASGALSGITELIMAGVVDHYNATTLAEALAAGPVRLQRLRLYLSHIGNKGLKTLVDSGVLRGVRELELNQGRFKAKGLLALMDPENGPQAPEYLILTRNSMGKPILQAMAAWEALSGVRLLDLSDVRITADNLAILHNSPHLDRRVIRGQ